MMKTVRTFEDLDIWRIGIEIYQWLSEVFYAKWFRNYWFQDQIMRASISLTNNIAEWFERRWNREFVNFLYYAKWSAGEVRSMLYLARHEWYLDEAAFQRFYAKLTEFSVKTYKLINHMKEN